MKKRYQVFVSSTFEDLKDERAKVMETILNFDCFPSGMEMFPAMDEEQFKYIKRIIDDSDYYLLIIGGRYGSVDDNGVSWTEKEFDYAVSKGIPVIAFDHKDFTQLPANRTDQDNKKRRKLVAFKKKVSTGRLINKWEDVNELALAVAKSLKRVLELQPRTGWVRADVIADSKLKERINNLQKEINELKDLAEKKEIERKNMERSYKLASYTKDQIQNEFKVFKLEAKKNEEQYNALRKSNEAAERKIDKLQKEINRNKDQEEKNRNDRSVLEKSKQEAQQEIENLREKIDSLEAELEKLRTSSESKEMISQIETITIPGTDVSFNMVHVEGGTFMMGADDIDNYAYVDEKPVHQVTLSDFYIGETQVTQALWQAVMGNNPSYFKGDLNLPVEMVSWNDCKNFIRKLNELTGKKFRLPTEAQWEFAARGGNKTNGFLCSGGNDIDDLAWYDRNSDNKTHPVGKNLPNELGLYDMIGNVMEWCKDWFEYYEKGIQSNPEGPFLGSRRVTRGCGWDGEAKYCRVSCRFRHYPEFKDRYIGLRLAL